MIQSAGAVLCKQWLVEIDHAIKEANLDAQVIAWVHDEVQIQVKKGDEDVVGNIARRAAKKREKRTASDAPSTRSMPSGELGEIPIEPDSDGAPELGLMMLYDVCREAMETRHQHKG